MKTTIRQTAGKNLARQGELEELVLKTIDKDRRITGDIRVEIRGRHAILTGTIESMEQKDLVTAIISQIAGIGKIDNQLEIDWMC